MDLSILRLKSSPHWLQTQIYCLFNQQNISGYETFWWWFNTVKKKKKKSQSRNREVMAAQNRCYNVFVLFFVRTATFLRCRSSRTDSSQHVKHVWPYELLYWLYWRKKKKKKEHIRHSHSSDPSARASICSRCCIEMLIFQINVNELHLH